MLTFVKRTERRHTDGTFLSAYLCSCGNGYFGLQREVARGKTTSCGCAVRERLRAFSTGREPANKHPEPYRAVTHALNSYRAGAKHREIGFDLTREDVERFVFSPCFYCGVPPCRLIKAKRWNQPAALVNGIDRLDNALGYAVNNCVTCCSDCNYLKRDRHVLDFLAKVRQISEVL